MLARLVGRPVREPSHRWVLVLVATLLVATTSPALAQDSATYGARPGPGDGDRSSGSFVLSVGTGSAISDAIEIFNLGGEPAAFDVYAVDVEHTSSGGRVAAARDAEPFAGPATWIAVELTVVEVPPRESALVGFTVAVPNGTPLGNHLAALMVEPHQAAGAGTFVSKTRVGLWVEIEVLEDTDAAPVPPGPAIPWDVPWIPLTAVALIAFAAVILYLSRQRWHAWLEQWREERALIRDFRSRRRNEAAPGTYERRG